MKMKLSDMLDHVESIPVDMAEKDLVSTERIKKATLKKIHKARSRRFAKRRRILAACFGLVALLGIGVWQSNVRSGIVAPDRTASPDKKASSSPLPQPQPETTLLSRLNALGISAQAVDAPQFVSNINMPKLDKEDLLDLMKRNPTIQGNISKAETVSVQEEDSTWYITTMTIAVDEVLTGNLNAGEVHIVFAVVVSGPPTDQIASSPGITGCLEGAEGVFILRTLDDISWNIAGKEVSPTDLGEYGLHLCLERENDTLVFREQNVEVPVSELR